MTGTGTTTNRRKETEKKEKGKGKPGEPNTLILCKEKKEAGETIIIQDYTPPPSFASCEGVNPCDDESSDQRPSLLGGRTVRPARVILKTGWRRSATAGETSRAPTYGTSETFTD